MSAEVGTLQASLNLDIRSFAEGISEATSLARSLGTTLREALGNSSQGFSSLLRETSALREEVTRLRSEAKAFKAELNQAATPEAFTQMQQYTSRLRENIIYAANGVDILSSSASKAETAMSGVGGEAQDTYMLLNAATGEVTELSDALKKAMGSAEGTSAATDDMADDMQRASASAKKTATNTKQVGTAAKSAAKETRSVGQHLNQASTFAKDLKRIIGGIIVSQAFYEMLNVMNELVFGSIKFANNMDQAQIAFKYLLGDASSAMSMIERLQDFAIASPLDTSAVMNATRKLMAMGFTAKSVIPTMQVLADTAAVFTSDAGDMSDMISHITLALGQMRASGKVMTQELRQLYNAGIPVFQILQEELGLTTDQVRNIGKQSIDSGTAVVALLKGLQKRYSGAAKEFTQTIPGALAVIKDSFSVLYSELAKTPQNNFKEWINGIANQFEALVMITRAYGPGGFLQAVFPLKLQNSIRNIVGAMRQLGKALAIAGQILRDIFGQALSYIVQMLGRILPPIMSFIHGLMQVVRWVYTTVPFVRQLASAFAALLIVYTAVRAIQGLWVLLKLGKVIAWFTSGLKVLVKTIYSWVKSLIVAAAANWKVTLAVLALVAVLSLIVANSDRAKEAMTRFFDAFKKMGVGFNTDDILQPEFDPGPAEDFNGSLSDIITDIDNLGDSADKTSKKIKKMFNQSFDEVFLIDDSQDDALSGLEDTDFSSILDDMDELLGKVDELAMTGDFWKDWGNISDSLNLDTSSFFDDIQGAANEFWKSVVEAFSAPEWVGTGIGAALGGVIGFIFGGPMGAKLGTALGAAAGWLAGLFWDDIVKLFESVGLNETTALSTSIAVPLGAAIGLKVGGPIGTIVGSAIGFLVSWIIGEITEGLETGDWTGVALPIGTGLGAGIGFLVGGPLGSLIGGAIGALVGWIVDMFIDGFTNGNWKPKKLGGAIGTGIGAGIGMIAGGPVGAAIGSAIGALVGWLIGLIVDNWDSISQWFKDLGANLVKGVGIIGDWFVSVGKSIGDFFKGIGKWFSGAWNNLKKWFSDVIGAIGGFFSDLGKWFANIGNLIGEFFSNIFNKIGEFFGNIFNKVGKFFSSLWNKITTGLAKFFAPIKKALDKLFSTISGILGDIWNGIVTVFNDIKNAVTTVLTEIWSVISEIFSFIFDLFVKIGTDIWNAVSGFFARIWEKVSSFFAEIWASISEFFTNIWNDFTTWLGDIWTKISTWFGEIWTSITTWLGDIWNSVATWFSDVWTKFTTWLDDIWTKFTTWLGEIWTKITTWFGELFSKIGEFFGNIFSKIGEFFGNIFSKIGEFFGDVWDKITGFFKDVWDKITGFFSDILTGIRDFFANIINSFADFISNLWTNIKNGVGNIYQTFKDWIKNLWDNVFGKFFEWIKDAIDKLREFFGLSNKAKSTPTPETSSNSPNTSSFSTSGFNVDTSNSGASALSYSTPMSGLPIDGHKDGGIFNREHVAWFAEDDKAEAIIPLQNPKAMQPFVDSVSTGVVQALAPFIVNQNNSEQLPPVYVGTLIADDRGLKELERKMRIIRVKEERRGG